MLAFSQDVLQLISEAVDDLVLFLSLLSSTHRQSASPD
jgi:hypothetical protein